jgi:hypothetical protein
VSIEARLVVWCHVSGLFTPVIPQRLIELARKFVFTSSCSLQAAVCQQLSPAARARLDVVSSTGGFAHLPPRSTRPPGTLSLGYVGSLQFSKLHPRYVDLVAGVDAAAAPIRMTGDPVTRTTLEAQALARGRPGLFEFVGFKTDVASELQALDVLVYLLNPEHYGTTENALLEAMAMGVVPLTMDNPAERAIIRHGETGIVVRTPEDVTAAVRHLGTDRAALARMGAAAAASVRAAFDPGRTALRFEKIYRDVMASPPCPVAFTGVFGTSPAAWFRSCQAEPERYAEDGTVRAPDTDTGRPSFFEKTKGSALHFHATFPGDPTLAGWARSLEAAS